MRQSTESFGFTIFIAGDLWDARRICREYCAIGLCVTVEPIEFIYTGGAETGVRVGLINYARFPCIPAALEKHAEALANRLREGLCQHSYTIVGPERTIWDSSRA